MPLTQRSFFTAARSDILLISGGDAFSQLYHGIFNSIMAFHDSITRLIPASWVGLNLRDDIYSSAMWVQEICASDGGTTKFY